MTNTDGIHVGRGELPLQVQARLAPQASKVLLDGHVALGLVRSLTS